MLKLNSLAFFLVSTTQFVGGAAFADNFSSANKIYTYSHKTSGIDNRLDVIVRGSSNLVGNSVRQTGGYKHYESTTSENWQYPESGASGKQASIEQVWSVFDYAQNSAQFGERNKAYIYQEGDENTAVFNQGSEKHISIKRYRKAISGDSDARKFYNNQFLQMPHEYKTFQAEKSIDGLLRSTQQGNQNTFRGHQLGESATIYNFQIGDRNSVSALQVGEWDEAFVGQQGSYNVTNILQHDDAKNAVRRLAVSQTGDYNYASIVQSDNAYVNFRLGQLLNIIQLAGNGNTAFVEQKNGAVSANIMQKGSNNLHHLVQENAIASPTTAYIVTIGNDNQASVRQDSGDSAAIVEQTGNQNIALMWQQKAGAYGRITQIGDGNEAILYQEAVSVTAEITQEGDSNFLSVTQQLSDANLEFTQRGNNLSYEYIQVGEASDISIIQEGSKSSVEIIQF